MSFSNKAVSWNHFQSIELTPKSIQRGSGIHVSQAKRALLIVQKRIILYNITTSSKNNTIALFACNADDQIGKFG